MERTAHITLTTMGLPTAYVVTFEWSPGAPQTYNDPEEAPELEIISIRRRGAGVSVPVSSITVDEEDQVNESLDRWLAEAHEAEQEREADHWRETQREREETC